MRLSESLRHITKRQQTFHLFVLGQSLQAMQDSGIKRKKPTQATSEGLPPSPLRVFWKLLASGNGCRFQYSYLSVWRHTRARRRFG